MIDAAWERFVRIAKVAVMVWAACLVVMIGVLIVLSAWDAVT